MLFFAVLRERLGRDTHTVDLPPTSTVADAHRALIAAFPALAALLPRVQTAVNQAVVGHSHTLYDGDEMALIPPVSGGADGPIAVLDRPLVLGDLVAQVESPAHGAVVTFTGVVRRHGQLPEVARLEYEAYVPMAEKELRAIADEIAEELPGTRVAIHHRVGVLAVGDIAVIIAVGAPHRGPAFDACRAAIERLKARAPIWKKEVGPDGAAWIGWGP